MSVVSGKSSDGDDSNSNFSGASSWSSALEISDFDVEFAAPEQVAIHPPSSGSAVSKVKSRPATHPSQKRTVAGTSLRQSVQAMRHRNVSPRRPTRVSGSTTIAAAVAPRTPIGGTRGRTNLRSVSPNRAGVPPMSVRVQQRPTSPLKTRRLSPRRARSGDHPLKPKFFIVVPPKSSSLPEDVAPSRISNGANKYRPTKLKHRTHPPPKPPKRTSDGAAPALTPKITAKGPKTNRQSSNRTKSVPIKGVNRKGVPPPSMNGKNKAKRKPSPVPPGKVLRRESADDALLQVPKKSAPPRTRSMPLELLTPEELLMVETVSSEEEEVEEMQFEEAPKHQRSRSLDREPSALTLFPAQFAQEPPTRKPKRNSMGTRQKKYTKPSKSNKKSKVRSRSLPKKDMRRNSDDDVSLQVPKKIVIINNKEVVQIETAAPQSMASVASESFNAPVGDVKQKKRRTRVSPNRARVNAEMHSLSPTRTVRTPMQSQPTTRQSISPGPITSRRKDHALGSVTMSGLEVPVVGLDPSVQSNAHGYRQQIPAKLPAEPKRYKIRARQRSRRDRLIEFKEGSFCIGNRAIDYETPPRSLVAIWAVIGIELTLDLITTAISFISFVQEPLLCCGDQIQHDNFHLGVTIPFFFLIVAEISFLFRAIFLSLWPRSTYTMDGEVTIEDEEEIASSDRAGIGKLMCCIDWSPKYIFWMVNLLTIINPYFGFFITWILMYQSDKNEALIVMGIEAASILLHFVAVHLENSAPTLKLKLMHMLAILAWLATIVMTFWYLQQGGVCYNSEISNFGFQGCEICPDGSKPIDGPKCPYTQVFRGRNVTTYELVVGWTLKHSTICEEDLQMCWYIY